MFRIAVCIAVVCGTTGCAARSGGRSSGPSPRPQTRASDAGGLARGRSWARSARDPKWLRPAASGGDADRGSWRCGAHGGAARRRGAPVAGDSSCGRPHSISGSASSTWRTSISPPRSSSIRRTRPPGTAWRGSGATGDSRISRWPDASRAVYYAPDSPVVHNTLGTVLQALGRRAEARAQYEKALAVDASAPMR